jgi:peroxiredoxin
VIATAIRALNVSVAEAVDRMVTRLQSSGAGAAAPGIGEPMPSFMLPDEDGHIVSLDSLLGSGPVAVSFMRGHWCPYCRLNAVAVSEVYDEIAAAGGRVIAITPERRKYTAALKAEANAPFSILTDMDNGYALSLNLAIWVGAELEQMMASAGRDLPRYQGNASWVLPIRATFIVAPDGVIAARFLDPDYRNRMDIDELVGAIREVREHHSPANRLRAAG